MEWNDFHGGVERKETAEQRASRLLAEELERRGWNSTELNRRKKGDSAKVEIAQRLRRETTVKGDVMLKDESVEEVRKARQEQAARWNFDLKAILADARKRQVKSGHKVISFATKLG